MTGKTILIAGADGFIGSYIYKYMSAGDYDLHGTIFYTSPGPKLHFVDYTDPASLENLPALHFDVCINAAGTVNQNLQKKKMKEINGDGCRLLLDRLKAEGCSHFIQLSSITVYGKRVVGEMRTEKTKRKKRGLATIPYGKSKALAEEHIEAAGLPYTILRLPPVLGAGDTALTPAIVDRFVRGDVFTCSSRKRLVSILCARNLPYYISEMIARGPMNEAFNIACCHPAWKELVLHYGSAWKELQDGRWKEEDIRTKGRMSFLFHLRDKDYLLNSMFSSFGSHFPTDEIENRISIRPRHSCEEEIYAAVRAYLKADTRRKVD